MRKVARNPERLNTGAVKELINILATAILALRDKLSFIAKYADIGMNTVSMGGEHRLEYIV